MNAFEGNSREDAEARERMESITRGEGPAQGGLKRICGGRDAQEARTARIHGARILAQALLDVLFHV